MSRTFALFMVAMCLVSGAVAVKKLKLQKMLEANSPIGSNFKKIAKSSLAEADFQKLVEMEAPKDDLISAIDELLQKIRDEQARGRVNYYSTNKYD